MTISLQELRELMNTGGAAEFSSVIEKIVDTHPRNVDPSLAFVTSEAEAVAAQASALVELIIVKSSFALSTTFTFTKNVLILRGAKITCTGQLLVLNGPFSAGAWPCFVAAAREVMFTPGSVEAVKPEWFGAAKDGLSDDAVAINAAIGGIWNGAAYTGTVALQGAYYTNTPILVTLPVGCFIDGGGPGRTVINFTPTTSGAAAFEVDAGGYDFGLSGVKITGTGTKQKIGVYLNGCDDSYVRDVYVAAPFTGNNGSSATPSIGLKITAGTATTVVERFQANADLPISIEGDLDHIHFADCYLTAGSANYNVEVKSGVNLQNVTFDGFQAWVKGLGGLYWSDSTGAGSSNVVLKNIRVEQSESASGWVIYISPQNYLYNLVIENLYGGLENNGLYIKNVYVGSLRNIFLITVSPQTPLTTTACSSLVYENAFFGSDTLKTAAFKVAGAIDYNYTTTAVNYSPSAQHHYVNVTVSGKTVTLPTAVGCAGREYKIDNASTGDITIATTSPLGQTIEGETTQTVPINSCIQVYSDGANWRIS
jgi:hypothetical protein